MPDAPVSASATAPMRRTASTPWRRCTWRTRSPGSRNGWPRTPEAAMSEPIPLCNSADLVEGGRAVPFDVVHGGETCRAFAVRFEGQPHAYLNRCSHVAMEMDFQPDRFFDDSGQWLFCVTHVAVYKPDTGEWTGGLCRGCLVKMALIESVGLVARHTARNLKVLILLSRPLPLRPRKARRKTWPKTPRSVPDGSVQRSRSSPSLR